jgi:hypothetical protein
MIERDDRAAPAVPGSASGRDPELDPATGDGNKSPDEIESEIARTRAHMSETLDALERTLAPRHLLEKGVDMLKDTMQGNINTRWVGETLRDNPIPLALIGVGLGWLLFHNVRATRGTATRYSRRLRDGMSDAVSGVGDTVGSAAGTVTERVKGWVGGGSGERYATGGEAYARTKSAGAQRAGAARTENERHMAGAAASGGGGVASRAADNGRSAAGAAGDYAGQAYETVGHYAGAAYDTAGEVVGQAGDYAARVTDRFGQVVEDYPLAVGALGFLAGAVIAAALPSTRVEDELLGETRDDLWRQGEGMAREAWERAQQAASGAADAARDAVGEVTEAARNAAGEFVDRVKDEAGKQGLDDDAVKDKAREAVGVADKDERAKSDSTKSPSGSGSQPGKSSTTGAGFAAGGSGGMSDGGAKSGSSSLGTTGSTNTDRSTTGAVGSATGGGTQNTGPSTVGVAGDNKPGGTDAKSDDKKA